MPRRAAPRAEFEPRPSRGDAAGYTVVCSDNGTTETTPTGAVVFYQCAMRGPGGGARAVFVCVETHSRLKKLETKT